MDKEGQVNMNLEEDEGKWRKMKENEVIKFLGKITRFLGKITRRLKDFEFG